MRYSFNYLMKMNQNTIWIKEFLCYKESYKKITLQFYNLGEKEETLENHKNFKLFDKRDYSVSWLRFIFYSLLQKNSNANTSDDKIKPRLKLGIVLIT